MHKFAKPKMERIKSSKGFDDVHSWHLHVIPLDYTAMKLLSGTSPNSAFTKVHDQTQHASLARLAIH